MTASTALVRADKWLWAVRLFKTRTLAAAACDSGKVLLGERRIKPSRELRVGDVITATTGDIRRTVKVLATLDHRVGAKLVPQYMEDLTPEAERQKPREPFYNSPPLRPRGSGRPTKKERRAWEGMDKAP